MLYLISKGRPQQKRFQAQYLRSIHHIIPVYSLLPNIVQYNTCYLEITCKPLVQKYKHFTCILNNTISNKDQMS